MTFDSPLVLIAAKGNPGGFISSLPKENLNIIDEVQMSPEIFIELKRAVDERRINDRDRDMFLLTGSANLMALPALSDALVGRMAVLTLLPISSAEYMGESSNFIARMFEGGFRYRNFHSADLPEIMLGATFPELASKTLESKSGQLGLGLADSDSIADFRIKFIEDYITNILQRDIKEIADIRKPEVIINILRMVAMRTGSAVNNNAITKEVGIEYPTCLNYKKFIHNTFMTFEIDAWDRPGRINKRMTKQKKEYFYDLNILLYMLGRDLRDVFINDRILAGHVFENFVATEIMKNAQGVPGLSISHFRTSDQKEVDFVLEKRNGDTIGIEVKLSHAPDVRDFAGLKILKEAVGEKFSCGIVLHTGSEMVTFGDDMWAVPVNFLWEK
jgi:predicted AAA+ superfamily ATPase